MGELAISAADLLLGSSCPGCGGPALGLCRPCGTSISPDPHETWPQPTPSALRSPTLVRPVAGGVNAGVLRATLIAWKEEGRFGLASHLAHLLAASVAELAADGEAVVLVPIPTSRRSRRVRGADVVDELARLAVRLLLMIGVDAAVEQALAYTRSTADQSGLDATERQGNLSGAFRARRGRPSGGRSVIIVDDILTTGATVGEAVRALTVVGRRPIGAAFVAATLRRSERR